MKKIITPGVREEVEYMCDVTGKPAVAELITDTDRKLVFGAPPCTGRCAGEREI